MSQIPPVMIPKNEWVDIYTEAGITKGTKLTIHNNGNYVVYLSNSPQKPVGGYGFDEILPNEFLTTESIPDGVWAYSTIGSILQISDGSSGGGFKPVVEVSGSEFPSTAFSELSVAQPSPEVQILASYGLTDKVQSIVQDGGATSANNSLFTANSGTSPTGIGSINTAKQLSYRPGQGALCRISALFSAGVANSLQAAGFINSEDGFAFGYLGENFGIIYSRNGEVEAQELTLSAAASGNETATVQINGINYNVAITSGTLQHNAYELSEALSLVVPNYLITSNDDTVFVMSQVPGAQGAFSYTSDGTSAGTFATIATGVEPTIDLIAQTDWNRNKAPWLNPQFGNVYSISLQYLGFGDIRFFVEDPITGKPMLVHVIEYANKNIIPSVGNPTFRIGWLARNLGGTTDLTVSGASAAGFIEGKVNIDNLPLAAQNTIASVGLTQTNIITLRNRFHFGGRINRAEIIPLLLTLGTDSDKGALFNLWVNPIFDDDMIFEYIDKQNSTAEVAKDPVTFSGGRFAGAFYVSSSGLVLSSNDFKTRILPDDLLTVSSAVVATPNALVTASANWQETT